MNAVCIRGTHVLQDFVSDFEGPNYFRSFSQKIASELEPKKKKGGVNLFLLSFPISLQRRFLFPTIVV